MPTDVDMEPDTPEVLQAESVEEPVVKVKVEGQVRTQALPTKGGATGTKTVSATGYVLLRADPRRKRASITCNDDIYVAFTEQGLQEASGCFVYFGSVNTNPLVIEAVVDIWVKPVAASASVSFMTELWAMGEGGN